MKIKIIPLSFLLQLKHKVQLINSKDLLLGIGKGSLCHIIVPRFLGLAELDKKLILI